jgi:multiple sugar transport system permease protein
MKSNSTLTIDIPSSIPRTGKSRSWWERNIRFLMISPGLLMMLAISIFPLLFSVVLSFLNWDLQSQSREFVF